MVRFFIYQTGDDANVLVDPLLSDEILIPSE
jgi:hypothetical protein